MLAGGDNNFGDFEDAFADGATTPASLPTLVGASRSSPAPSDLSLGSDADRFDLAFAEVDGRDSAAFHEQVFSDIAGDLQGLEAFQDACDDGLGPAEGEDAAAGDDPDPGPDGQGSVEVADAIPDDALEMFFCKWDECVAPAVGDRLRKRDADGQLVKQSDTRSHPGTRTDNNMLRLGFLRFAPKGATAAHDDYNSAQMLIREVALCKQAGFVMAIYAAIQQHKGTPSGGKWMFWSRRNDESHFDVAFSPGEAAIGFCGNFSVWNTILCWSQKMLRPSPKSSPQGRQVLCTSWRKMLGSDGPLAKVMMPSSISSYRLVRSNGHRHQIWSSHATGYQANVWTSATYATELCHIWTLA